MNKIDFQVLEDRSDITPAITRETWFITRAKGPSPLRREVYKINGEIVIALRDGGVGIDQALYLEENFFDFFKGEPELEAILKDQGVLDTNKIKTFRME